MRNEDKNIGIQFTVPLNSAKKNMEIEMVKGKKLDDLAFSSLCMSYWSTSIEYESAQETDPLFRASSGLKRPFESVKVSNLDVPAGWMPSDCNAISKNDTHLICVCGHLGLYAAGYVWDSIWCS